MSDVKASEEFVRTWTPPKGFFGFFAEVNSQPLGRRFMLTSMIFFVLGGLLALLMRIQLATPENSFLDAETYNRFFTMHGSTMMYLFAVPFLEGLAVYLTPLLIGSRDVAFPRLTSFSYWTYLFGGIIFYASFLWGAVPDAGWFSYTPLSTSRYAGLGQDFWLLGLALVEVGGIAAGLEIVVSILKLRAPGMSLSRMPLFGWANLVAGFMIVFAFPVLFMATLLLEMDRSLATRFFDVNYGGSDLLWQHLFWFFGHPEVYIMFIPATGVISMIIPAFAKREIAGYHLIAAAIVITGFVSFGLWVHHMFATGLPQLALMFFTAASLLIALASGTQVFAWIATLWGRAVEYKTPLLYALGFLFLFVLGGLTGVMVAVVPFDLQVHDTYFVIAHFHYVLIGGVVFPIFGAIHYWLPKITGKMMNETLGKLEFWLIFLGFNIAFFPMHIMGFHGMPRRVYTYSESLKLGGHNMLSTVGAFILGAGILVLFFNFLLSFRKRNASMNPWNTNSLEWTISSPPPVYSFFKPAVYKSENEKELQQLTEALSGEPSQFRATLATHPLSGQPQAVQYLPGPSYAPFWTAVGLVFASVGMLLKFPLIVCFGFIVTLSALAVWFKLPTDLVEKVRDSGIEKKTKLPVFTRDLRTVDLWAILGFVTVLLICLVSLFFSYFYIQLYSEVWPQGGLPKPEWLLPLATLGLFAVSPVFYLMVRKPMYLNQLFKASFILLTPALMILGSLVLQIWHLLNLPFEHSRNAYASLFHVMGWTQALIHLSALAFLSFLIFFMWKTKAGDQPQVRRLGYLTFVYWCSAVVLSGMIFLVLYVSPYVV